MAEYQIFTDATADISESYMPGVPQVEVIPMDIKVGEQSYIYGSNGNITPEKFYGFLRDGEFATTSQINPAVYMEHFEPVLKEGKDILYLCFSSGMSGTYQAAYIAIQDLKVNYPKRKIVCIDTLCAAIGEGFLVRAALEKQNEGMKMAELVRWLLENRLKVCHWFTVDTFKHLLHGGRVSVSSAVLGSTLQIKPLLHVDEVGKLAVREKPRGRKKAIHAQMKRMEEGWRPDISKFVLIGHGDDPEGAKMLEEQVKERFPEADTYMAEIGPVIGAHTGPGILALIYWGDNR